MSASDNKSYLSAGINAISPWGSRTSSPKPAPAAVVEAPVDDASLRNLRRGDHTISHRHSISLKNYPRDCPSVNVKWFYAVDVPKRKPLPLNQPPKNAKPPPRPKKYVPFSSDDSRSIETAFQKLVDGEDTQKHMSLQQEDEAGEIGANNRVRSASTRNTSIHDAEGEHEGGEVMVPVNEDYLFDVDIERRELAPAYWLGPIYEVARGSWFYQEGSTLRPCDENLAIQLEEGYIKVKPWRYPQAPQRSASQTRSRPTSLKVGEQVTSLVGSSVGIAKSKGSSENLKQGSPPADSNSKETKPQQSHQLQTHRLFGGYMGSVVTYQDSSVAWLLNDDIYSRVSSTVYQRFAGGGHLGGIKVIRGYTEPGSKIKDAKDVKDDKVDAGKGSRTPTATNHPEELQPHDASKADKEARRKSAPPLNLSNHASSEEPAIKSPESEIKRQALERDMSSFVSSAEPNDPEKQEEQVRIRDEKEIQDDYRDEASEEQGREIEHLILVTHGIGQRLGLRMESVNFVHDVNVLRKTLKAIYASSPDLQALNAEVDKLPKNCRVQVLPVCWRHLLDFPKQSLKQNKREQDLGDVDALGDDEAYPSLDDITIEGVPAVRSLITDLALDILLYQSGYREHIAGIVQRECNRIYKLFLERNPYFSGKISLVGHSLGSAILFDILCRQHDKREPQSSQRSHYRNRSNTGGDKSVNDNLKLDFEVEDFFCLGSPVGLFQMLKGNTIAGRSATLGALAADTSLESGVLDDPFLGASANPSVAGKHSGSFSLPLTISSPRCAQLFNIFHPTDPISYRMEPLISPAMATLKPQPLPFTKKGIFAAPGLTGIGARVGQSVSGLWSSLSSGIASSMLNRSLGITGEEGKMLATPTNQNRQRAASHSQQTSLPLSIGAGTNISGGVISGDIGASTQAEGLTDDRKRRLVQDTLSAEQAGEHPPTLIDADIETLYAGFQKRRKSHQSDDSRDLGESPEWQEAEERGKRLRREEAKVRALNSNGRVDFSIQEKYPQFKQDEIFSLQDSFRKLDVDDKGYIDEGTVIKATQQSEKQPYDVVRQALKEVELDSSRRVELDDYVDLISKVRGSSPAQKRMSTGPGRSSAEAGGGAAPSPGHASKSSVGGRIQVQGSSSNVTHTINEDERTEFTRHINAVLAGDPDIGSRLPFPTDTFEMFDDCKDGLVLAKLINDSVPDTIDERVLNRAGKKIKSLNAFHMTENNNIVINSAKGIGCSVVNIGSGDIIEVREHLILGLIWQIIRRGLLGKIDIKLHPELYRLLEEDETLEQFLRLPPEQILLRWFNYHLKAAKWERRVSNFSSDVKDGENYTILLNQLSPENCSRGPLQTRDLHQRAEQVLQNADRLECRKFLTSSSLVAGNGKLNLAFVANLFNTHPGLDPITEEEKLVVEDFDAEGEREARVFTLWLNSLDVQPAVNSLFDDLRDGTVLLQAYDKVIKGSVNWRHVNKAPASGAELMRFKAVENTNYAIELGKQNRFSLVGVQGADITDGQRTLTLGLVWQLMRKDISETLSELAQRLGKREITDAEMVKWANDMTRKGGKSSSVRSFKDQSIGSGVFLLDVLNGMKSSYVDYDLVTNGKTEEDSYANAKLSISIARKMGATIWLVPEDICQVRSRLVVTFIGKQIHHPSPEMWVSISLLEADVGIGSLMATYEKM
ncbi:MAG: hypothetical protein M1812_000032 [Candelaria pacifica]|nr:MAG: hypothetical protein M1812_000032 [Candelaria pacifica]